LQIQVKIKCSIESRRATCPNSILLDYFETFGLRRKSVKLRDCEWASRSTAYLHLIIVVETEKVCSRPVLQRFSTSQYNLIAFVPRRVFSTSHRLRGVYSLATSRLRSSSFSSAVASDMRGSGCHSSIKSLISYIMLD
jgi:hypothetical protein